MVSLFLRAAKSWFKRLSLQVHSMYELDKQVRTSVFQTWPTRLGTLGQSHWPLWTIFWPTWDQVAQSWVSSLQAFFLLTDWVSQLNVANTEVSLYGSSQISNAGQRSLAGLEQWLACRCPRPSSWAVAEHTKLHSQICGLLMKNIKLKGLWEFRLYSTKEISFDRIYSRIWHNCESY